MVDTDFLYKGERIIRVMPLIKKHTTKKRRIRLFAHGVSENNQFQIDLLSDKDKTAKWGFYHALAEMVGNHTAIIFEGRQAKGLFVAWLNANRNGGDSERGDLGGLPELLHN